MFEKQEMQEQLKKIRGEIESKRYQIPLNLLRLVQNDKLVMSYITEGQGGFYYQFLALFVKYFKPQNILELGNAYGISTVMMYSELSPNAKLTSVDIDKDQRYVPEEIYKDSRVRFIWGDALDLNIYKGNIPNNIDFLFTDTVHFYQQVKDEYDVYVSLLSDGAFILIDDIYVKDKSKLFKELPFEKWDLTSWCHGNGFGLLRYKKQKTHENPLLAAALESSRIGHRKFYALKKDLDSQAYRKFYAKARSWAAKHMGTANFIRAVLKPIKKLYTPNDKEY
jgi:predicted O-methyltransferase YrrM